MAAAQAASMADAGMGGMEEMPEGAGGEEVTPEDIVQVIEFLLAQGQITPEEAEKILTELAASEQEGAMPPEEKEAMAKAAAAEQDFEKLVAAAIK